MEFSKSEARGTLTLIFIILSTIIFSQLYVGYLKKEENNINPTQKEALEEWVSAVKSSIRLREVKKNTFHTSEPNKNISVPPYSKQKEISGKDLVESNEEKEVTSVEGEVIIRDLNSASKEDLQQIYGIGPAFSERIIKYRDLLGGFASIDQLREVYGLKEETITEIKKTYKVGSPPSPLDINADSVKVLARHPYISYDLGWAIVNYRKQNGNITSIKDLEKIKAIDRRLLEKLRPYLVK